MRRGRRITIGGALGALAALALPPAALAAGEEPAGGAAIGEIVLATAGATIATAGLFALGIGHRSGRTQLLGRFARWSSRISGLPVWVALPSGLVAGSLIVALLGMYWDIALHIGVGRDEGPLANPAHYLILFGLFGIFAGGVLSMFLATERPSPSAVRITRDWHVPLGSILIAACGAFALIGFPLDDIWHRLFGQDVTLWGPTHLMLIGGASLTLVGQAILLAEAARARKDEGRPDEPPSWHRTLRRAALAGAFLLGLSTFQAEFDFGVPQFHFVFQPMLIALAASVALVSTRVWGGPGAALYAVAFWLALRGLVSFAVGPVLGETTPHFPLYIVEALIVEAVAWFVATRRPLTLGAVAGALIGTVGFAAEWGWSHIWMPLPWPESLLPEAAVAALVAGVAGGVLGALVGAALRVPPRGLPAGARVALPVASLAVVGLIAYGLSTTTHSQINGRVTLQDVPGEGGRAVSATVALDPPTAAADAHWLTMTAWQGDGLVVDRLERVGPGTYRTTEPTPVHGNWKALVRLHSGRSLSALPVFLPEDRAIPAREVPARAAFTRPFQSDKKILQREAKSNAAVLSVLAYGTVLAIAVGLLALLAWGLARVARVEEEQEPPARRPRPTPRRRASPAAPVARRPA